MERKTRTHHRRKFTGLVGLFLLGGGLLFSQNAYQVSPRDIHYWKDQRFTVYIDTDLPDPEGIRILEANWPQQIRLVEGPIVRSFDWEKEGRLIEGSRISFSFQVLDSGLTGAGPIRIQHPNGVMVIPPFPMVFVLWDERNNPYPMEVEWRLPSGPYFQNKPILAQLMIKNLENVEIPFGNDISSPPGAVMDKASELGAVQTSSFFHHRLHEIPWGTWLLTPTRTGELVLPRPAVTYRGVRRIPSLRRIQVEELPASLDQTQAVGQFEYEVIPSRTTLSAEEGLEVKMLLKGEGNFPFLRLPEMNFDGFDVVQTISSEDFQISLQGYKGEISRTFHLIPHGPGRFQIPVPSFSWYNPFRQDVLTTRHRSINLEITSPGEEGGIFSPLSFLSWKDVWASLSLNLFRNPWAYFLLLPGIIYFFTVILSNRQKTKPLLVLLSFGLLGAAVFTPPEPELYKEAKRAFSEEDYQAAEEALLELQLEHPYLGGLDYNIALIHYQKGKGDLAVVSLIEGWRKGLRHSALYQLFERIKEEMALEGSLQPFWGFSEDLLFVIFSLFLNLSFILWAKLLSSKRINLVFYLVFSFLGVAAAFSAGLITLGSEYSSIGVLQQSVELLRVPSAEATPWIPLGQGTVLEILGYHNGFYQIRNSNGITGWVEEKHLHSFFPHKEK